METIIEIRKIILYDIDNLSSLVITVDYSYTHCGIRMWVLCGRNFDDYPGAFKKELANI